MGLCVATARATGQRHRIEDQHDLAITQHRRAINTDNARELRANVLDDDFLVAHQFVDLDGYPPIAAAQ